MNLKLDENLGERGAGLFRSAGHHATTVFEQGMSSATDDGLIAACQAERRCLVTLDLDFSNPLLFPPKDYSGIAVLRLPRKPTDEDLWACCQTLIDAWRDAGSRASSGSSKATASASINRNMTRTDMARLPRKCWHEVVKLRDGLRSGDLPLNIFAADLYEVLMQSGKRPVYEHPEKFFALTFPTYSLRDSRFEVALSSLPQARRLLIVRT